MLGTADDAECGNRRVISICHILAEKNFCHKESANVVGLTNMESVISRIMVKEFFMSFELRIIEVGSSVC